VGLIQNIENAILDRLKKFFEPVLTPLAKLWKIIKSFASALIDVIPETISLVKFIISEVQAWKNFKEGINFKTGVINLQSARNRIEQIISEIIDGWNALKNLFTDGFKLPIKSVNEMAEAAQEVASAFEEFFGKFGLQEFLARLGPTLEKAGGKVLEVFALLEAAAEAALRVVRQIHDILTAVKDIRETFQTGEGLFLSQKNSRKTLRLEDGTAIRIRVGSLHEAS
jgi:phage-related protein